jgi:hypothetical protein
MSREKEEVEVDETGQDTAGDFFLVSVVISGEEHGRIWREAERIEQAMERGILKWHKTAFDSSPMPLT